MKYRVIASLLVLAALAGAAYLMSDDGAQPTQASQPPAGKKFNF